MAKYIIEIEDTPLSYNNCETELYRCTSAPWWVIDRKILDRLTPFDECRPSWWDEAYQKGLNDAWGAARKLVRDTCVRDLEDMGFLCRNETQYPSKVLEKFTAAEAIAKICEYEEKKKAEEEIKVGDEVYNTNNYRYAVVLKVFPSDDPQATIYEDRGLIHTPPCRALKKTGRHFPQLAEVLKQMHEREAQG